MDMTRRRFVKALGLISPSLANLVARLFGGVPLSASESVAEAAPKEEGFPAGSYTPFGYLDNPYHSWALHQSGVLRSVPPIGFGLYYPAGPGGYFDYQRNSIYRVLLRLGFKIGDRVFYAVSDFRDAGVELSSSNHTKNVLTFSFQIPPLKITIPFFLIGENTLACTVGLENVGATEQEVVLCAVQKFELGPVGWWGRDGLAGVYRSAKDQVLLRSFAAGPVFALASDLPSSDQIVTEDDAAVAAWMKGSGPASRNATSYFPKPLNAGMSFNRRIPAKGKVQCSLFLSRSVDERQVEEEIRSSRARATTVYLEKRTEDDSCWTHAPRLDGDFPRHWKNSWVYDFETLRMMVRRPLGFYKHPWDAMQIQAPRNVLAETSIDMWTLSYADEKTAKDVLLGQFQDAVEPNVPCMREDGSMNMVAADGSECGTSLQWCYPFYCIESVFLRTLDRDWLGELYPYLVAHLDWTLKNRRDNDGWIVAKCSWESGMDASRRFLIQQPTGGEVTDFVRVAELQAAMAHAASAMKAFAEVIGKSEDISRWDRLVSTYAEKTRQLWHQQWFYDVDARSGNPIVIPGSREVTQVAPVMCGVATDEQIRAMIPKMREYESEQGYWLEWPSLLLPYAEAVWRAGDREFLSRLLYTIIDRVYASMDRRVLQPEKKLGWPGISCEVWGINGAYGGEGYGWGATLPAHIIRSVFGFREGGEPRRPWFTLGPNLPEALLANGKSFALRNVHYRGRSFDLKYERRPEGKLQARLHFAEDSTTRGLKIADETGVTVAVSGSESQWSFEAKNHGLYRIEFSG